MGSDCIDWGVGNMDLSTTGAINNEAEIWQDTDPTSTLITIGNTTFNNNSGNEIVGYAFHSVEGFSKFGSFTGNANADGPFIYTGFMPELVIIKSGQVSTNWMTWDSERDTYNEVRNYLTVETNSTEASGTDNRLDFLSNGFKLRTAHADMNHASTTIYMAWAKTPFKYANAR